MTSTPDSNMAETIAVDTQPAKTTLGKPEEVDIEFVLRNIEENNLDRTTFNAKQIFNKNVGYFGDRGSDKRKLMGRYISNNIKRCSWQHYADLLEKKGINMSETTEAGLENEVNGLDESKMTEARQNEQTMEEDKEEERQDHHEVSCTLPSTTTLIPPFASNNSFDQLLTDFQAVGISSPPAKGVTFGGG